MRVETEEPVAVLERVRAGTAHLAVFHGDSLVDEFTRPVGDLPSPSPEPGEIYTVDLDADPVSLTFDESLTAAYRRADPVRTDLVETVEFVRTHVVDETRARGPAQFVRVEFRLDHLVGTHDYACHLFCKSDGATTHARTAASGYHVGVDDTAAVEFPLDERIDDLAGDRPLDPDCGLVADVAVLVSKNPARGPTPAGTPFDPTWTPPESSQHDIVRLDRVVLDPHWRTDRRA